jgi:6-phosphogluconolactonase (cycloisomerase 2 family)
VERLPTVTYFSPKGIPLEPSDSPTGTQVRQTENCFSPQIYNTVCNTTIYKPNNTQFAQQGGVSSSSRISRLKYNTLNQNGAEYNSASGAMGVNSGRYQSEPSPSYYVKNKPQEPVCERKTGKKSYCPVPPPLPPASIKNYYAYISNQSQVSGNSSFSMYSINSNTGELVPLSPPTIPNDNDLSISMTAATINNSTSLYVSNIYFSSGTIASSLSSYKINNNGQLALLSTQLIPGAFFVNGLSIASINNENYLYFADLAGFIVMNKFDNTGQLVPLSPPSITLSSQPAFITTTTLNNHTYAYVTNLTNLTLMYEITADGQLVPLSPPTVTGSIFNLATITLNNNTSYAYTIDSTNSLLTYSINPNTGILSLISTQFLSGLDLPSSITTAKINNNAYAYVTNNGSAVVNSISIYSIADTGELSLLSQTNTGFINSYPRAIAIVAL